MADDVRDGDDGSVTGAVLRSSTLYVILASSFVGVIGIPLISPTLPAIRNVFGVSDVQVGLMITVYTLPIIVLAPVVGALADRWGRKPILVTALVCYGVFGSAIAFTPVYTLVLVLRFLQGAAASGLITLSLILVGDHFDGPRRNAAMGLNSAIISIGASTSPFVGGMLAEIQWNAPFVVYSLAILIAVYAYSTLTPVETTAGDMSVTYFRDTVRVLSTPTALTLYLTVFGMFVLLFGAVYTLFPLMLDSVYGLDTGTIGLILTASPAVSALVASSNGVLARYFSTNQLVVGGIGLAAVAMLGVGVAHHPYVLAALIIVVFGAAKGVGQPAFDTAISTVTPPEFRGSAMSIRTSVKNVGGSVGPVAFTSMAAVYAYGTLFAVAGAFTLVLTGFALFVIVLSDD